MLVHGPLETTVVAVVAYMSHWRKIGWSQGAVLGICLPECRWWFDLCYNSPDLWLEIGLHHTCLIPHYPPQVQPDVDCLEPCSGGDQQWGRLLLSLEYDFGSQEVRLTQQVQRLCG